MQVQSPGMQVVLGLCHAAAGLLLWASLILALVVAAGSKAPGSLHEGKHVAWWGVGG